jgi:hypothetical protein
VPTVAELTVKLPPAWRDALNALPTLYGPAREVLASARARLPDVPAIDNALHALEALAQVGEPHVEALHIDLVERRSLRGLPEGRQREDGKQYRGHQPIEAKDGQFTASGLGHGGLGSEWPEVYTRPARAASPTSSASAWVTYACA